MNSDPKVPAFLLEMQTWFGKIAKRPLRELDSYRIPLYDEETEKEIGQRISAGPHLSAAQRIGIYNQQYWFRLFAMLQDFYPTLTRLFGPGDFNDLIAEPYLQKYSDLHWSIPRLGLRLPRWIEEEYQDEDRSLILQAARVDDLHERLSLAPKLPSPKITDFWKSPFYLQPFVSAVSLTGDFFNFREELLKEEPSYWIENDFPKIDGSKKLLFAVYCRGGKIWREEISASQLKLLQAFEKGASLQEACSAIDESAEAGVVGSWFQNWAARGWFTTEAFHWA